MLGANADDERWLKESIGEESFKSVLECENLAREGLSRRSLSNLFSAAGCPLPPNQNDSVSDYFVKRIAGVQGSAQNDVGILRELTPAQKSLLDLIDDKRVAGSEYRKLAQKLESE